MRKDSNPCDLPSLGEDSRRESSPPSETIQKEFEKHPDDLSVEAGTLSGYDLVTRVLDHPEGSLEALIELAGGAETDWLEFKAAMISRPEDLKPTEKDANGHWNVAEAVLAMANTHGGAVLVGIDDDGKTVGLQSGDPRKVIEKNGLEAFRRMEIKDKIRPASGRCKWQTLRGIWELQEAWPPDQFTVRGATHKGHEIAIIIVRPVPANGSCLLALQNGEERLLRRASGHIGQVETVKRSRAILEAESSRCPTSPELFALWEGFRRSAEEGVSEEEDLEAAIAAWHENYRANAVDLLIKFTPLDAAESLSDDKAFDMLIPRELFEPEAIETLPDYLRDDWLDFADREDESLEDSECDSEDRPARRGGLFELLAGEPRCVVLGEPGGGKTTCLRRFALDAVTGYEPGDIVTLFVPLTRWQVAGGLEGLVRRHTGLSRGQFDRLIRSNRCRLLFDALNECPDALRRTAINALTDLLREHPNLPAVITARAPETTVDLHLPTFTVQPLSGEQRRAFLKAYLSNPAEADHLLERIRSQPGGENLSSNPLLLRMIIEVASQGGKLPLGRAALYRQWIANWHKRESDKAKDAGDSLPWELVDTRRGLGAIALASRLQGTRFAEDFLAQESLVGIVGDPAEFLERMTEGPLILRNEGRLEFRHESFQEYLCAEALLANPHAINRASLSDKTTWGMVLVQAAQLASLPEPLADVAWIMDPWLGAALSPRGLLSKEVEKQRLLWSPHAFEALLFLNGGSPCPEMTRSTLEPGWYQKADPVLRDAIFSVPGVNERWLEFETNLLRNAINEELLVLGYLRQAIGDPSDLLARVGSDIKSNLLAHCGPICAHGLCDLGVFDVGNFEGRRRDWITHATPYDAVACVKGRWFSITAKDFHDRRTEFAAGADPEQAGHLVFWGICKPEDFADRRSALIANINPWLASYLVYTKICGPEDFSEQRAELAEKADPKQAAQLVRTKICTSKDFENRRADLTAQTDSEQASHLVTAGILGPEDFATRRAELAADAGPGQAGHLVWAKICTADDFVGRQAELAARADSGQSEQLVSAKICAPDDFSGRRAELAAKALPDKASLLVYTKICTPEDFADRRAVLAAGAKAGEVSSLIDSGICSASDFDRRKAELAAQVNATAVGHFVRLGICTPEDFEDRRAELAAQANAMEAGHLVRRKICKPKDFEDRRAELAAGTDAGELGFLLDARICSVSDFVDRRAELAAQATAKEAGHLIRRGICTPNDFEDRRAELAAGTDAKQATHLVSAGICKPEDFTDRRADLAAGATAGEVGFLVDTRICSVSDFADRMAELAAQADATEAGHLVRRGICTPEDFADRRADLAAGATAGEVGFLVDTRICSALDFVDRRVALAAQADAMEAGHLVRQEVCSASDFDERRSEFAVQANATVAGHLVRTGICTPEDFADRRADFAAVADCWTAVNLVQLEICIPDDFKGRRAELAAVAVRPIAMDLVRFGICAPNDFTGQRKSWGKRFSQERSAFLASARNANQTDPCVSEKLNVPLNSGDDSTESPAPSPKSLLVKTTDSLKDQHFQGILNHVSTGGLFGFIECSAFPGKVFFHKSAWPTGGVPMESNIKVRFQVNILKDKKNNVWGYAAQNVEVICDPQNESQTPETASEHDDVERSEMTKPSSVEKGNETAYSLDGVHGLQPMDPGSEDSE